MLVANNSIADKELVQKYRCPECDKVINVRNVSDSAYLPLSKLICPFCKTFVKLELEGYKLCQLCETRVGDTYVGGAVGCVCNTCKSIIQKWLDACNKQKKFFNKAKNFGVVKK